MQLLGRKRPTGHDNSKANTPTKAHSNEPKPIGPVNCVEARVVQGVHEHKRPKEKEEGGDRDSSLMHQNPPEIYQQLTPLSHFPHCAFMSRRKCTPHFHSSRYSLSE
jgi:hypothetical protein